MLVAQSCSTLCDPMDCSALGSCPRDSPGRNTGAGCHFLPQSIALSQDWTQVSCTVRRLFTIWATWEAQLKQSHRKQQLENWPKAPWQLSRRVIWYQNLNFFSFSFYWIYYNIAFFWPEGIWDLSSLTRDWNCNPCIRRWSLNHWTTSKSSKT